MEFSGFFQLSGLLECSFGKAKSVNISTICEVFIQSKLGSAAIRLSY